MNIRHLASRVLPPFIYDAARTRRNVSPSFNSYEEAAAACAGYNDPAIASAMAHHAALLYARLRAAVPIFTASDVKVIWAATRAVRGASLDVIDFGGAYGYDYFAVRAGLPEDVAIRWQVIETEAMVRAARQFVAGLDDQTRRELHFHTSWDEARGACPAPDLLHSASAIICVARPDDCLHEHIACDARFMFFTRIGLADGPTRYSVQTRLLSKGVTKLPPGMDDRVVSYPLTWPSREAFERVLQERYAIIARLQEENPIFVVGEEKITGYGCLARRP